MFNRGLIIGKFNPIHEGHIALIQFALNSVTQLEICVCYPVDDLFSSRLRTQWVKNICWRIGGKRILVHSISDAKLSFKNDPDWETSKIWANYLQQRLGKFDAIFSSEKSGEYISLVLQCKHIMFDPSRRNIPVFATNIRNAPFAYWKFIPAEVRPYFIKKICLYGSESTGKTTVGKQLAAHFNTHFVPEMAREWLGDRKCVESDFMPIARLQLSEVQHKTLSANKLLFCDTDLITSQIYSEVYFNTCDPFVLDCQRLEKYDLYLFFDIDLPWVEDAQRDLGNRRSELHERFKQELDQRDIPYVLLQGTGEARFQNALNAVQEAFEGV
jgi:HTH-type transcriptional regulator, transcriptional repressor of NAD biosynthesis genes